MPPPLGGGRESTHCWRPMPPDLPLSRSGHTAPEVARRCAQEGARIVMEGLGKAQDVRAKGRGNIVTAADLASERAIQEILAAEYPDHSILSEETAGGWRYPTR